MVTVSSIAASGSDTRALLGEIDRQIPVHAAEAMSDAPFVGCFTFGEQGFLADRNMHGNLMISAVAFGR